MKTAGPPFDPAGREKEEFVRMLVHTLQAPVAELQCTVDRFASEPGQAGALAAKAHTSLAQIKRVIADMQSLTSAPPRSFMDALSIIDIQAATREGLKACRDRTDNRSICMERCGLKQPALARFDPDLYRLVLANLCTCALEGSGCRTASVRLEVADGWASIRVESGTKGRSRAIQEPAGRWLSKIRPVIERYGGTLEPQDRSGLGPFVFGLPLYAHSG